MQKTREKKDDDTGGAWSVLRLKDVSLVYFLFTDTQKSQVGHPEHQLKVRGEENRIFPNLIFASSHQL